MIILHKTDRHSALQILRDGFSTKSVLTQDRVAKFMSNLAMIDNNQIDNDECNMFFLWKGPTTETNHDKRIEEMKPEILYVCGRWRCAITQSEESLIFLGATLSGEIAKSDVEFYQAVSDSINMPIAIYP